MNAAPSHWIRPRRCVSCGGTFTLEQHATPEARDAADHLDHGTLDPSVLPPLISKCPACLSGAAPARMPNTGMKMSEAEAIAAAMAIGDRMRLEAGNPYMPFVKKIGFGVSFLGAIGMLLAGALMYLRRGEQDGLAWLLVTGMLFGIGAGVTAWAFFRTGRGPR